MAMTAGAPSAPGGPPRSPPRGSAPRGPRQQSMPSPSPAARGYPAVKQTSLPPPPAHLAHLPPPPPGTGMGTGHLPPPPHHASLPPPPVNAPPPQWAQGPPPRHGTAARQTTGSSNGTASSYTTASASGQHTGHDSWSQQPGEWTQSPATYSPVAMSSYTAVSGPGAGYAFPPGQPSQAGQVPFSQSPSSSRNPGAGAVAGKPDQRAKTQPVPVSRRTMSSGAMAPVAEQRGQSTPAPSSMPPRTTSVSSAAGSMQSLSLAGAAGSAPLPPEKDLPPPPGEGPQHAPATAAPSSSGPGSGPAPSSSTSAPSIATTAPITPTTPIIPANPNRPRATAKETLSADGSNPITTTLYLDPTLRDVLFNVPAGITTAADTTLSSLAKYGDGSFNWTTGAPINGMAQLAKSYIVPPDIKITSEHGNVTLRLGVVDEVGGGVDPIVEKNGEPVLDDKGQPKRKPRGRGKGRVLIETRRGGVFVEILEMDKNRQLDLAIETGKGDVFVLLPETFHGPIHATAPDKPHFGGILTPQLADVVNPYGDLWTTAVVPLGVPRKMKKGFKGLGKNVAGSGLAHGLMKAVAKYVPEDFREQDDYVDMAQGAYLGAGKGSQSKIVVKTEKGKVAFGYAKSRDSELAEELGLVVGEGKKGKKWWQDVL